MDNTHAYTLWCILPTFTIKNSRNVGQYKKTQLRAVKGMYKRNFLAGLGFGFASGMMFLGFFSAGEKRPETPARIFWRTAGAWYIL